MEDHKPQESIPEQIISDMLINLSAVECFDEKVLRSLRQLAAQGKLNKPTNVEQALKILEKSSA